MTQLLWRASIVVLVVVASAWESSAMAASGASSLSGTGQPAFPTDPGAGLGNWNAIYAQGFSLGTNDSGFGAAGVTPGSAASLTQFQFFRSGRTSVNDDGTGGTLPTPTNVQLAIVNNFFLDLSTFTTSSPELVALSTNTIATIPVSNLSSGEPLTFTFDNVPLTYGPSSALNTAYDYAAIFVNNNGGTLTPVRVPAIIVNYVQNPPGSGTYVPLHDYGNPTVDYRNAVSNYINGTFFATFNGYYADADFIANFSFTPLKGDFDGNGVVDVSDVQAMMNALSNLSGFQSANSLTADDLKALGDFDDDKMVTNADLQGLIVSIANAGGSSSLAAVPEPMSLALLAIGGPIVLRLRKK